MPENGPECRNLLNEQKLHLEFVLLRNFLACHFLVGKNFGLTVKPKGPVLYHNGN